MNSTHRTTEHRETPRAPAVTLLCIFVATMIAACDVNRDGSRSARGDGTGGDDRAPITLHSDLVRVTAGEQDAAMQAAMEAARETLASARAQWSPDDESMRSAWAIKWPAETIDGGSEHLWVRPVAWTEHRIEGVLLNTPLSELVRTCRQGDTISFAASDASDWVRFTDEARTQYEGGYTLRVIAQRGNQSPTP